MSKMKALLSEMSFSDYTFKSFESLPSRVRKERLTLESENDVVEITYTSKPEPEIIFKCSEFFLKFPIKELTDYPFRGKFMENLVTYLNRLTREHLELKSFAQLFEYRYVKSLSNKFSPFSKKELLSKIDWSTMVPHTEKEVRRWTTPDGEVHELELAYNGDTFKVNLYSGIPAKIVLREGLFGFADEVKRGIGRRSLIFDVIIGNELIEYGQYNDDLHHNPHFHELLQRLETIKQEYPDHCKR